MRERSCSTLSKDREDMRAMLFSILSLYIYICVLERRGCEGFQKRHEQQQSCFAENIHVGVAVDSFFFSISCFTYFHHGKGISVVLCRLLCILQVSVHRRKTAVWGVFHVPLRVVSPWKYQQFKKHSFSSHLFHLVCSLLFQFNVFQRHHLLAERSFSLQCVGRYACLCCCTRCYNCHTQNSTAACSSVQQQQQEGAAAAARYSNSSRMQQQQQYSRVD